MKSITILSFLIFVSFNAFAQENTEAYKILDTFSDNALRAPSVSMKFKLVTLNQADNTSDTLNGSVIISRDKYKLELPDNLIWFNGSTSWSYLPEEKEVTITKAERKDNSFQSKPSLIFSMYKKGFKTRLIDQSGNSYVIDLYPEDLKGELLRIRLRIGKSQLNLSNLEYKKKDGTTITIQITEYNLTVKPEPETFVFDPENFKGVEVIDMR